MMRGGHWGWGRSTSQLAYWSRQWRRYSQQLQHLHIFRTHPQSVPNMNKHLDEINILSNECTLTRTYVLGIRSSGCRRDFLHWLVEWQWANHVHLPRKRRGSFQEDRTHRIYESGREHSVNSPNFTRLCTRSSSDITDYLQYRQFPTPKATQTRTRFRTHPHQLSVPYAPTVSTIRTNILTKYIFYPTNVL